MSFLNSLNSLGSNIMGGLSSVGNSLFGSFGNTNNGIQTNMNGDLATTGAIKNLGTGSQPSLFSFDRMIGDGKNIGWLTGGASIFKDLSAIQQGIAATDLAKKQMGLTTDFANQNAQMQVDAHNKAMLKNYIGSPTLQAQYGLTPEEYVAKYGWHADTIQ